MEKRLRLGLLPVLGLLLTCSFRPYPLLLWITVLPFLCNSVLFSFTLLTLPTECRLFLCVFVFSLEK
nr:hypothetical protein [Klebsiella pneumoniae]